MTSFSRKTLRAFYTCSPLPPPWYHKKGVTNETPSLSPILSISSTNPLPILSIISRSSSSSLPPSYYPLPILCILLPPSLPLPLPLPLLLLFIIHPEANTLCSHTIGAINQLSRESLRHWRRRDTRYGWTSSE